MNQILKPKVKYPINSCISSHKLSKSYASYVHQLFYVSIPCKLKDALADSRWIKAIAGEMEALKKNEPWQLVSLPRGRRLLGVGGCLPLNTRLMKMLRGSRLHLLQQIIRILTT